MRRCLVGLTALALFALQSQSLAFHVHASIAAHHDDEHRHGPAIHDHGHVDFDEERHLGIADEAHSSGTAITVAVPAAPAAAAAVAIAEMTETVRASELRLIGEARAVDVRSHGPPPARDSFLRGPPSATLL